MTQFNFDGRAYTVVATSNLPATANFLQAKGFDGAVYIAEARPVGRQRVTATRMFFRVAHTGEFRPTT